MAPHRWYGETDYTTCIWGFNLLSQKRSNCDKQDGGDGCSLMAQRSAPAGSGRRRCRNSISPWQQSQAFNSYIAMAQISHQ